MEATQLGNILARIINGMTADVGMDDSGEAKELAQLACNELKIANSK